MVAENSNNDQIGVFFTQLSISQYYVNLSDEPKICNMASPKTNKIVPENSVEQRTAWSDHEICRENCDQSISCQSCKAMLRRSDDCESLLVQDKSKIVTNNSSAVKNGCQYFVKIDINDSDIKKVWRSDADKNVESETLLLHSDCSPKGKTTNINRKKKIKQKICLYLPRFLLLVSLLQVGLFIWDKGLRKWLVYSPSQRHQIWRFATYALMHSDVLHLTLNVVLQILIGSTLEYEQDWLRTALVYLGGCVAGAMGSSVLQPMLYICGSSGGIYAMLLSHLPHIWLNRGTIHFKRYRIVIVATLVISDAAYTIAHWLIHTNTNPTISLPAHGVGAISGALLGMVIYKGTDISDVYTKIAIVTSAVILMSSLVFTVLCNLHYIVIFYG